MAASISVRSWRPRNLIITAIVFTVLLVGGAVVGWIALPAEIRARFTILQVLTLLAILGLLVAVMWLLAGSSVRADAEGLRIRNAWRVHHIGWEQIRRIHLRPGDPWATLERRAAPPPAPDEDAPRLMMMGIQGSEGEPARQAVADLNAELARRAD